MNAPLKPPRDKRLDVFRGLCMLIIFIAHMPDNPWLAWIPARFGYSSATELFVFGSGFASAIAFGRPFLQTGFWNGLLKISQRIWQVYWAHLGLFVVLAGLTVFAAPATSHAAKALGYLFTNPAEAVAGLVTLRYVPMLLDILPLYIVVLALVPVMMASHRVHPVAPFALSTALYLATWTLGLAMPGRPDGGQPWFFNPFAWQLIFFLGFAIGLGWWKPPALNRPLLLGLAAAVVIVSVPLNFWAFTDRFPVLIDLQDAVLPANTWTNLHPVRLLHFLALAYVTLSLVERAPFVLDGRPAAILTLVGTQSLPAFLACTALAWSGGILLDSLGRDGTTVALTNLAGLAGVVAAAWIARLYKSEPWTRREPASTRLQRTKAMQTMA
jgi:hypothetical protein